MLIEMGEIADGIGLGWRKISMQFHLRRKFEQDACIRRAQKGGLDQKQTFSH